MTIPLILIVLVIGMLIGKYPQIFVRNFSTFMKWPRYALAWLFKRMTKNPHVCAAFIAGFFVGLMISGTLTDWLRIASLVGFAAFCLLIFFPESGGKAVQATANFASRCVRRVKEFF